MRSWIKDNAITLILLVLLAGALFLPTRKAHSDPISETQIVTFKNIRLSEHFTANEFRCPCCGELKIDYHLIECLEILRTALGNKPIIITSGYRCEKHNKEVGGAEHSQHCFGKAVDIKVKGVNPAKVAEVAKRCGFTFTKVYSTWTHVDVR